VPQKSLVRVIVPIIIGIIIVLFLSLYYLEVRTLPAKNSNYQIANIALVREENHGPRR
jgi:hypothetical protein